MTEKKLKKVEQKLEWEQAKSRLMYEMTRHIGKERAIGAGELFEAVFEKPYEGNKMTGCRLLRKLIEEVKYGPEAIFIAHSCCTIRPGYYLPRTDSERREYVARVARQVKKKIGRLALLNQMNAGAYAGQLALELQETQFPERS
ncbi:MAG: hypothetical protein M1438_03160 [Deltaproteobacteria bacterium]|nr:hypothetical protein [Deltaproteobacteria bacterium]